MKTILKIAGITLAFCAVFYCAFAFTTMQPNPFDWTMNLRGVLSFVFVASILIATIAVATSQDKE
jgi:hypothetical protein